MARAIEIPISTGDLARTEQPSLFFAVQLSGEHSDQFEELAVGTHGYVAEVGFGGGLADPLWSLPPRNLAFCREFMRDRFFWVTSGDCGSDLARLEINEALVEDTYMRGSIDYTGFQMILTLREEAYRMFANLAEIGRPRPMFDHRSIVLGMPTPAFTLPAQRGSPTPGDAKIKYATNLQPIKRLEVSDMVVAVVNRRASAPSDSASILDRFEILSATKLSLANS